MVYRRWNSCFSFSFILACSVGCAPTDMSEPEQKISPAEAEVVAVDTVFRIGSNTKTLTGTLILQLVDEGKIHLGDPVSKYWAECAWRRPDYD